MKRRGSGVLLHVTSLPSAYGVGDVGPSAFAFVDLLAQAGQSYWQVLPLNPTGPIEGNSPYNALSAFAGNAFLISPEYLARDGLIGQENQCPIPEFPWARVDYRKARAFKIRCLDLVSDHLSLRGIRDNYEKFCFENSYWLEDYAFFEVLKAEFRDKVWNEWPAEIRDRNPEAIKRFAERFGNKIATEKFLQFVFFSQWAALKDYCNGKGIQIIGDVPIYTSYQSADVWAHPELFKLDNDKRPTFVSGVPPDYFSKTGQLWGNPVYNWDNLQETGFKWWIRRIEHNFRLFDAVRIDHFRGFIGYWEVPAGEKTAENGRWVNAPGTEFFTEMLASLPGAQIIAEDLGMITADVRELMRQFNFPGMRPLLFAFGRDLPNSSYAPHNHIQNCLVYTGTHDNNTVRGWFETEASNEDKRRLFRYLGREIAASDIHREFIRLAMMSVADTVILPMQDILGLGADARMNVPSTTAGNWEWRLRPGQFTFRVAEELRDVTEIYGRLSRKPDAVTPAP